MLGKDVVSMLEHLHYNIHICLCVCLSVSVEWYVSSPRARSCLTMSYISTTNGRRCSGDLVWSQSIQSDACVWWHLWWVFFCSCFTWNHHITLSSGRSNGSYLTLHRAIVKVKVKAVDLYSASSCTPKAGGQAGVPPPMHSRHWLEPLATQATPHSLHTQAWVATRPLARQRQSAVGLHYRNPSLMDYYSSY